MDYIQGNSLNKALEEYGAQPQENVIEWAKQLCDVLGYLHSRVPPIIYRDMKPANIMLKPDGNVTLIDFGTAREFKEKNLADTTCLGTVGYAAPEQFGGMGQTDARTDIYCLGATLYHLVTGMNPCEPPYEIKPIRDINPALSSGLERIILKCTQRDPNDRYQSAAELMYALEHYEEIDDIYKKKQKKKLVWFLVSCAMTLVFAATSVWGYFAAENKKSENYDVILKSADETKDYYDAIRTDPTKTTAYLQLNDFLVSDYVLTKAEGKDLLQLQAGLSQTNGAGYSENIEVLERLKAADPNGYYDVCFTTGWNFLSYYDAELDRDRYSNAAKWFKEVKDVDSENGSIAAIFYDIFECTNKINQLHGGKVIQTQDLNTQRNKLWTMVQELKTKSNSYADDYKIQAWIEIDKLINNNISDFLEVASKDVLISLLNKIQSDVSEVHGSNPELVKLIGQLKTSTAKTITRIETAK